MSRPEDLIPPVGPDPDPEKRPGADRRPFDPDRYRIPTELYGVRFTAPQTGFRKAAEETNPLAKAGALLTGTFQHLGALFGFAPEQVELGQFGSDVGFDIDVTAPSTTATEEAIEDLVGDGAGTLNRLRAWRRYFSVAGTESILGPAIKGAVTGEPQKFTIGGRYESGSLAPPQDFSEKLTDMLLGPLTGGLVPGLGAYGATKAAISPLLRSTALRPMFRKMLGSSVGIPSGLTPAEAATLYGPREAIRIASTEKAIAATSELFADIGSGIGYAGAYGAREHYERTGEIASLGDVKDYLLLGGAFGAIISGPIQFGRYNRAIRRWGSAAGEGKIGLQGQLDYIKSNLPDGYETGNLQWNAGSKRWKNRDGSFAKAPWSDDATTLMNSGLDNQQSLGLTKAIVDSQVGALNAALRRNGISKKPLDQIFREGKAEEALAALNESEPLESLVMMSPKQRAAATRITIPEDSDLPQVLATFGDDPDLAASKAWKLQDMSVEWAEARVAQQTDQQLAHEMNLLDQFWRDIETNPVDQRMQALAQSSALKNAMYHAGRADSEGLKLLGVNDPTTMFPVPDQGVERTASSIAAATTPEEFEAGIAGLQVAVQNSSNSKARSRNNQILNRTLEKRKYNEIVLGGDGSAAADKLADKLWDARLERHRGLADGMEVEFKDGDVVTRGTIVGGLADGTVDISTGAKLHRKVDVSQLTIVGRQGDWVMLNHGPQIVPGIIVDDLGNGSYTMIFANSSVPGSGKMIRGTVSGDRIAYIAPSPDQFSGGVHSRLTTARTNMQNRFREVLGDKLPSDIEWIPTAEHRLVNFDGGTWELTHIDVDGRAYRLHHPEWGVEKEITRDSWIKGYEPPMELPTNIADAPTVAPDPQPGVRTVTPVDVDPKTNAYIGPERQLALAGTTPPQILAPNQLPKPKHHILYKRLPTDQAQAALDAHAAGDLESVASILRTDRDGQINLRPVAEATKPGHVTLAVEVPSGIGRQKQGLDQVLNFVKTGDIDDPKTLLQAHALYDPKEAVEGLGGLYRVPDERFSSLPLVKELIDSGNPKEGLKLYKKELSNSLYIPPEHKEVLNTAAKLGTTEAKLAVDQPAMNAPVASGLTTKQRLLRYVMEGQGGEDTPTPGGIDRTRLKSGHHQAVSVLRMLNAPLRTVREGMRRIFKNDTELGGALREVQRLQRELNLENPAQLEQFREEVVRVYGDVLDRMGPTSPEDAPTTLIMDNPLNPGQQLEIEVSAGLSRGTGRARLETARNAARDHVPSIYRTPELVSEVFPEGLTGRGVPGGSGKIFLIGDQSLGGSKTALNEALGTAIGVTGRDVGDIYVRPVRGGVERRARDSESFKNLVRGLAPDDPNEPIVPGRPTETQIRDRAAALQGEQPQVIDDISSPIQKSRDKILSGEKTATLRPRKIDRITGSGTYKLGDKMVEVEDLGLVSHDPELQQAAFGSEPPRTGDAKKWADGDKALYGYRFKVLGDALDERGALSKARQELYEIRNLAEGRKRAVREEFIDRATEQTFDEGVDEVVYVRDLDDARKISAVDTRAIESARSRGIPVTEIFKGDDGQWRVLDPDGQGLNAYRLEQTRQNVAETLLKASGVGEPLGAQGTRQIRVRVKGARGAGDRQFVNLAEPTTIPGGAASRLINESQISRAARETREAEALGIKSPLELEYELLQAVEGGNAGEITRLQRELNSFRWPEGTSRAGNNHYPYNVPALARRKQIARDFSPERVMEIVEERQRSAELSYIDDIGVVDKRSTGARDRGPGTDLDLSQARQREMPVSQQAEQLERDAAATELRDLKRSPEVETGAVELSERGYPLTRGDVETLPEGFRRKAQERSLTGKDIALLLDDPQFETKGGRVIGPDTRAKLQFIRTQYEGDLGGPARGVARESVRDLAGAQSLADEALKRRAGTEHAKALRQRDMFIDEMAHELVKNGEYPDRATAFAAINADMRETILELGKRAERALKNPSAATPDEIASWQSIASVFDPGIDRGVRLSNQATSWEDQLFKLGKIAHNFDAGSGFQAGAREWVHPLHPTLHGWIRKNGDGRWRVYAGDADMNAADWRSREVTSGVVETRQEAMEVMADLGLQRSSLRYLFGEYEHIKNLTPPERMSPEDVIEANRELATALRMFDDAGSPIPQSIIDFGNDFIDNGWARYWDVDEPALLHGDENLRLIGRQREGRATTVQPETENLPTGTRASSRFARSDDGTLHELMSGADFAAMENPSVSSYHRLENLPEHLRLAEWEKMAMDAHDQDRFLQFAYMDQEGFNRAMNPAFDAYGDLDWIAFPRVVYQDGPALRVGLMDKPNLGVGKTTSTIRYWDAATRSWNKKEIAKADIQTSLRPGDPYDIRALDGIYDGNRGMPIRRVREEGLSPIDEKFGLEAGPDYAENLRQKLTDIVIKPESLPFIRRGSDGKFHWTLGTDEDSITDLLDWTIRAAEMGEKDPFGAIINQTKEMMRVGGIDRPVNSGEFRETVRYAALSRAKELIGDPSKMEVDLIAKAKLGMLEPRMLTGIKEQVDALVKSSPEFAHIKKAPVWQQLELLTGERLDTNMLNSWPDVIRGSLLHLLGDETGSIPAFGTGPLARAVHSIRELRPMMKGDLSAKQFWTAFPRTIQDIHPTAGRVIRAVNSAFSRKGVDAKRYRELLDYHWRAYDPSGTALTQSRDIIKKYKGDWDSFIRHAPDAAIDEWENKILTYKNQGKSYELPFRKFFTEVSDELENARMEQASRHMEGGFEVVKVDEDLFDLKSHDPEFIDMVGQRMGRNGMDELEDMVRAGEVVSLLGDAVEKKNPFEVKWYVQNVLRKRFDDWLDVDPWIKEKIETTTGWNWMGDEFDFWNTYGIDNLWPTVHTGRLRIMKYMPGKKAQRLAYAKSETDARRWLSGLIKSGDKDVQDVINYHKKSGRPYREILQDNDGAYFKIESDGHAYDADDFDLLDPAILGELVAKTQAGETTIDAGMDLAGLGRILEGHERRGVDLNAPASAIRSITTDPYDELQLYFSRLVNDRYVNEVLQGVDSARKTDADLSAAFSVDALWPQVLEGADKDLSAADKRIFRWVNDFVKSSIGQRTDGEIRIDGLLRGLYWMQHAGKKVTRSLDQRAREAIGEKDPMVNVRRFIRDDFGKADDFYQQFGGKNVSRSILHGQALLRLGFSPAAAMVNGMQWVINSLPLLGADNTMNGLKDWNFMFTRRTYRQEANRMLHAYGPDWMAKVRAGEAKTSLPNKWLNLNELLRDSGVDLWMAKDQVDDQFLKTKYDLVNPALRPLKKSMDQLEHVSMWGFKTAEKNNRAITALGAAHMGRSQGLEGQALISFVRDFVEKTQFQYAEIGLPKFMRSSHMRVLTQFKPFMFNQLKYETNLMTAALRGDEHAKAAFGWHYGALALMGGASGLMYSPWGYGAMAAWNVAGGPSTETNGPYDSNTEGFIHNLMYNHFGGKSRIESGNQRFDTPWFRAKSVLAYGLPGLFNADLSRRLNVSGPELYATTLHDAGAFFLGPHVSMYKDFLQALADNEEMAPQMGAAGRTLAGVAAIVGFPTLKGFGGLAAGTAVAGLASVGREEQFVSPGAAGKAVNLPAAGAVAGSLVGYAAGRGLGGAVGGTVGAAVGTALEGARPGTTERNLTPGLLFNTKKGRRFVNNVTPTLFRNLNTSAEMLRYGYTYDIGMNKDQIGDIHENNRIGWLWSDTPKTTASINEAVLRGFGITSARKMNDRGYIQVLRDENTHRQRLRDHWADRVAQAILSEGDWVSVSVEAEKHGVYVTESMLTDRIERLQRSQFEREPEAVLRELRPPASAFGAH